MANYDWFVVSTPKKSLMKTKIVPYYINYLPFYILSDEVHVRIWSADNTLTQYPNA